MKNYVKVNHHLIKKETHDLLSKYYDLDDERGICTITYQIEKFTDFFDTTSAKRPILKYELKEALENVFLEIPKAYSFNFIMKINNYENYSIEEATDIFKENMRLIGLKNKRKSKNMKIFAITLLLIGILTLFIMIILNNTIFANSNNQITKDIVSEVLDIAAWVFIWESVTIYFIDKNEDKHKFLNAMKRINSIKFE